MSETISDNETRAFIEAVQLVEDAGWVVLRPEQVRTSAAGAVKAEPVAWPKHWEFDAETMALRVEALADGVEDRFGGIRAEMSTGGSLSVKNVCDMLAELLRFNSTLTTRDVTEQVTTVMVSRAQRAYGDAMMAAGYSGAVYPEWMEAALRAALTGVK